MPGRTRMSFSLVAHAPSRCLHGPRRPCCPPFPLACPLLTSQLVFAILGVQLFGGRLASCVLYIPPPSSRLALPPSDPAFRGDTLLVPMRGFANRSACEGAATGLEAAYDLGRIASGTLCDRAELTIAARVRPRRGDVLIFPHGTVKRAKLQHFSRGKPLVIFNDMMRVRHDLCISSFALL